MRRTINININILIEHHAQEREAWDRIGEGGEEAKKRKKLQKMISFRRGVENWEDYDY